MQDELKEKYWSEVNRMLAATNNESEDNLKGLKEIRESWERNKKWLFPYFDKNGRKEVAIEMGCNEHLSEAIQKGKDILYARENNRIAKSEIPLSVRTGVSLSIMQAVYDRFVRIIGAECLKTNQIDVGNIRAFKSLFQNGANTVKVTKLMDTIILQNKLQSTFSFFGHYEPWTSRIDEIRDEELLKAISNEFQIALSKTIEVLKNAKTNICLSINPLDILTMSANTNGNSWSSCHNFDLGEYPLGALAYICDRNSAIAFAYVKRSSYRCRHRYTTDLEFPVKTWRQMVAFNENEHAALMGRQYPTVLKNYEMHARELAAQVLAKVTGATSTKRSVIFCYGYDEHTPMSKKESVSTISVDYTRNCLNYIYNGDCPTSIFMLSSRVNLHRYLSFDIGVGELPCLKCGGYDEDEDGFNRYYCGLCAGRLFRCYECGEVWDMDDAHSIDGYNYCSCCFNEIAFICSYCNRAFPVEEKRKIEYSCYCPECFEKLFSKCNRCGDYYKNILCTNIGGKNYCPDCAEEVQYEEKEKAEEIVGSTFYTF